MAGLFGVFISNSDEDIFIIREYTKIIHTGENMANLIRVGLILLNISVL